MKELNLLAWQLGVLVQLIYKIHLQNYGKIGLKGTSRGHLIQLLAQGSIIPVYIIVGKFHLFLKTEGANPPIQLLGTIPEKWKIPPSSSYAKQGTANILALQGQEVVH